MKQLTPSSLLRSRSLPVLTSNQPVIQFAKWLHILLRSQKVSSISCRGLSIGPSGVVRTNYSVQMRLNENKPNPAADRLSLLANGYVHIRPIFSSKEHPSGVQLLFTNRKGWTSPGQQPAETTPVGGPYQNVFWYWSPGYYKFPYCHRYMFRRNDPQNIH